MALLADYVQRLGQYLNAFKMEAVSDDPATNAAGGKPGFPNGKLERAARDAAAAIFTLIASNPTHPRRSSLMTPATIAASGDLLPAHLGPIGAVRIAAKHADRTSADDVQRLIDNVLGLTLTEGHYGLDAERIYFAGTPCTVDVVAPPAEPVDPDIVPEEFVNAVVARALAFLFPLEGENLAAAQHFDKIASDYEARVANNISPPEVPAFEG